MTGLTTAAAPFRPRGQLRPRVFRGLKLAALLLFVLIFLIPVYVMLVTSFKPLSQADQYHMWQLPKALSLSSWKIAWDHVSPAFVNTLHFAVPGAIISSALGSMNGFVLSRWRFPGSDVIFTLFLFGMFIPYQAVMLPLTQLLMKTHGWGAFHLDNSLNGLMLAHIVYGIPICTLIFRNYYAGIPTDLIEAARVDGAGMLGTYRRVILPNSGPAFAVAIIWQFTSMWNDFLFALFLITTPSLWPVTVQVNNLSGSLVTPFNQQMSAALLASLPTLIVYLVLGRFFMRGLMAGSLKG
jgi:glucose/mannose transport system permease protein